LILAITARPKLPTSLLYGDLTTLRYPRQYGRLLRSPRSSGSSRRFAADPGGSRLSPWSNRPSSARWRHVIWSRRRSPWWVASRSLVKTARAAETAVRDLTLEALILVDRAARSSRNGARLMGCGSRPCRARSWYIRTSTSTCWNDAAIY